MSFTITLFYAGLLALMLLALSMQVVILRRRHGVGVGAGERQDLGLAVRAQANFCEYVPLGLLLLLLLEASGALAPVMLHGLGVMLLFGRLLHGFFGLNRSAGTSMGRFVGTLLTWLMIATAALFSVGLAIGWWLSGV
jgi:uncharacterized protein